MIPWHILKCCAVSFACFDSLADRPREQMFLVLWGPASHVCMYVCMIVYTCARPVCHSDTVCGLVGRHCLGHHTMACLSSSCRVPQIYASNTTVVCLLACLPYKYTFVPQPALLWCLHCGVCRESSFTAALLLMDPCGQQECATYTSLHLALAALSLWVVLSPARYLP